MTNQEKIKQQIERKKAQIEDLMILPGKSDQEYEEIEQLQKDLNHLINQLAQVGPKNKPKELDKFDMSFEQKILDSDKKFKQLEQDNPKKLHLDETELELRNIRAMTKDAQNKIKLAKEKDKLFKLQDELKDIEKEASYMTEKPDKNGYIAIRQNVYEDRMNKLLDKLKAAKTRNERFNIKMEILELKGIKAQIKTQNTMIKVGRGVNKFSNFVAQLGDELGKLGEVGDGMGGYTSQSSSSKPKKSKKRKGKKSRKKKSSSKKSNDSFNDFGFNEGSVFKF